jgi:protein-S-isoprenylcysteine O-methyltransferase Ste14
LLGAALVLVAIILIGVVPSLAFLLNVAVRLFSTFLVTVGLAMVLNAAWELKDKFSIFLHPASATTEVVTSGVYGVVRHPMYGGLILLCGGQAMLQLPFHAYKAFFALVLLAVLVRKSPPCPALLRFGSAD